MKRKIICLTLVVLFIMSSNAYAHKPLFEGKDSSFENPVVIPDYQVSYVVYGKLKNKSDVDVVKFNGKMGETFYVEMDVPITKGNQGFKPYIALIGPGIYQKDKLPFKIPEGLGSIEIPPSGYKYFYEKYTHTSYNEGQSIRGEIPKDGGYYIAIYTYDRGGKYALAIGEKEKFGLADILTFPKTLLKVKCFFSPFMVIAALLIIFGVLVLLFRIFIKKRRRR